MNSKQIYDYLINNEIEKAKQALLEDICIKESKNKNTTKGIQKLSKIIQKNALSDGRASLAGAIYNGIDTFMCDGMTLFVAYNEKIEGLTMAIEPYQDFQYNKIFIDTTDKEQLNICKLELKIAMTNKEEQITLENGMRFNTKKLYDILNCFEEPRIYKINDYMLQLEESNKKAVIMGIRGN